MVRENALAARHGVSLLREPQRAGRLSAQNDAIPLPGEGVCEAVQRVDRDGHAVVKARLSALGHRHLPVVHEPQGHQQHEAPPGADDPPEKCMAPLAPAPRHPHGDHAREDGGSGRSRRDVHRRQGEGQTRQAEAPRGPRAGR